MLFDARRRQHLATSGVYAYVRHPQYVAFIVIMLGFLLQWPTLLTLAMFPILVAMYVRLARGEERDAIAEFGDEYRRYMLRVPAWSAPSDAAVFVAPASMSCRRSRFCAMKPRFSNRQAYRAELRSLLASNVLLQFPNVLVTPHNAYNMVDAVHRIIDTTLVNIEAFARGAPQNVVT